MRFTNCALAGAALASLAAAQVHVATLTGSAQEEFGFEVEDVGDVNGDGVRDFAVGAPAATSGSALPGKVIVYDGRTLLPIHTWLGANGGDRFGWAIAGLGDLDGDGRSEVLVGAPMSTECGSGVTGGAGYARVYDGASGAIRYSYSGSSFDRFGYAVAGGGHADGDGVPDFVIGAPGASWYDGLARLYSGATGLPLLDLWEPSFANWYGSAVAFLRDVDQNGTDEVLVGAPGPGIWDDWEGQVDVFDAASGASIHSFFGSSTNQEFGWTIEVIPDVSGDGVKDIYVGGRENGFYSLADGRGMFRVYNGRTFTLIYSRTNTTTHEGMGLDVAPMGDLDGDGRGDFAVSRPGDSWCGGVQNSIRVYTAVGGTLLFTLPASGASGDRYGFALAHLDAGDDLLGDLLVGVPGADGAGANSGRVEIYNVVRAPTAYCRAEVNSLGCTPAIAWSGTASASAASVFDVSASSVLSQKYGLCFYGLAPQSAPFQGGFLCAKAPLERTPIQLSGGSASGNDCSGQFHFDFNARIQSGVDPDLVAGAQVYAQYWSRDPADAGGTNTSDALAFFILP